MNDGEVLLQELLNAEFDKEDQEKESRVNPPQAPLPSSDESGEKKKQDNETHTQWALGGNGKFVPVGSTVERLPAGIYETFANPGSWGLEKSNIASDGIYLLPDMATETVLTEVKKFWVSEPRYRKHKLLYKRGLLLWGPPGGGKCLGLDTPILMFDGSVKMVQDINMGDLLMGDDSTSRKVLSLARGKEMMYRVTPTKGAPYIVNESHILSLKRHGRSSKARRPQTKVVDISVLDYINSSLTFKHHFKGYRTGVNFPAMPVSLDPYFLGAWLGDGSSTKAAITTMDQPIEDMVHDTADSFGLSVRKELAGGKSKSLFLTATNKPGNGKQGKNQVLSRLQNMNLLGNKHIPKEYLVNSEEVRLNLLAGLLDTDGYFHHGHFEISTKFDILSEDILYLCRSLGFAAYKTTSTKYCQTGEGGQYHRITISGNVSRIPTRLTRKQAGPRQQVKDVLVTGIKVEPIGVDNYYGFEIDGNHRFLLGDFTVTHNTVCVKLLMNELVKQDGIVILAQSIPLLILCLKAIRRIEPTRNLIVVLEDIDEIINFNGESSVLSMLDGENNVDNILHLATTNYPERLGARIVNRPSRFDRRVFVGMPSTEARRAYLQKATDYGLSEAQLEEWVKDSKEMSIAHLRELVAAVYCLDQPYEEVIQRLKDMAAQIKPTDEFTRSKMGFKVPAGMMGGLPSAN